MKFVCVDCDETLMMKKADTADKGTMSVTFECRMCGWQMGMLTNPMETQMVRSMGLKFGENGRTSYMELIQGSVATAGEESTAAKCPFPGVVEEAHKGPELVLRWTAGAEARMESVPEAVREMIRSGVEQYARRYGYRRIDESLLDDMKNRFTM